MCARLTVLIVMLAAASAHADGIVLEAYAGERPVDAARLIAPVVEELARVERMIAGEQLRRVIEVSGSRPAATPEGLPADFAERVELGFRAWINGEFDDAIRTLGPLTEAARANSGALAANQALREPLRKALIGLALAEQRAGDPAAMKAALAELVRSFPDAQVSRGVYGSDAYTAFDQVKRELAEGGQGRLAIQVAQDSAAVFVDEAYRGQGSTALALPPGEYRVLAMLDRQPSRVHVVTVRANAETRIAIDAELDQAITTREWTGLLFATDAAREAHAAPYAAGLANALYAPSAVVLGIEQVNGRAAIVGAVVSLQSGREVRRASVAIAPEPSLDQLRALAHYLSGEPAGPGIDVLARSGSPEEPHDRSPVAQRSGRWGGWKYLAGGGAVAGLATGITLAALDGKCQSQPVLGRPCIDFYAFSPYQWVAIGAGAALAGVSVYLFATLAHERTGRTAYLVPAPGGAVVGYAARW